MNKVFVIDGGAGRAIAAIPALEKYARKNPNEDFTILVFGWEGFFFGNPLLQSRTFSADQKGIFENVIKNSQIIRPEPYQRWSYYNQKTSIAEAFDEEINQTDDHSDLGVPHIYLSKNEEKAAANFLSDVYNAQRKQKTIVIQPYGRSARIDREDVIDDSTRSIEPDTYLKLVKKLSQKYNVVFFGEKPFVHPADSYSAKAEVDLRTWAAIIEASDYFIGCDSVGQHMARAFNKPGTVVLGSTFAVNTTYPDWFQIIEKTGVEKRYSPIRICGFDCHLADRLNDGLMNFDDKEVDDIYKKITDDIEKKVKK